MKLGMSVDEAVREASDDLRALKGGLLSQITIHAIDVKGHHKVLTINGVKDNYLLWTEEQELPVTLLAESLTISEWSKNSP